jgi:hypothetical protein
MTAEDIQVDGKNTEERTRLWVINRCGKDEVLATRNKWMVGEKGANRTTRRGEWVTHGSKGKVEGRITWQEEDPQGLNTEQLRGAVLHERR